MRFGCSFSLNWKSMKSLLLMMHWKCTVLLCTIENWSSANKHFPKYGPSNIAFHFFSRIYLSLFSRGFCQKFYEKIVLFYWKFFQIHINIYTTQNFKILIFLLLKLRRLTYNAKFENNRFFIGLLAEGTTNTW